MHPGVDLRVTNGLRVLSMWFVILGHTISYGEWFNSVAYPSVAIAPYLWSVSFFSKWYQGFFFSGWYSVDTFLFIGGLVCGSRASLAVEQHKQRHAQADTPLGARLRSELKFWGLFALSRWLRLLPSLVMVIVSFWFLVPSFGSSPWWQRHWDIVYGEQCGDYWWSTVLLIQNFIPAPRDPNALDTSTGICLGPSWYLAVDFQLHVFVAPLVLCTWHYAPQAARWARDGALHLPGTALIGAMLAATVAATAGVVVTRNCVLQGYGVGDFYFYYIKPWVRAPPYLFGLLLGLLLHNLSKLEPRGGLERAGRAEERPRRKRHLEDEIAGAVGRQRSTGKRAPQQLTATQRRVVAALVAAHGEDVGAMAKDLKLNKMQHSAGVLRKMVASFRECAPCSVAT